jgi:hypothetical protein
MLAVPVAPGTGTLSEAMAALREELGMVKLDEVRELVERPSARIVR